MDRLSAVSVRHRLCPSAPPRCKPDTTFGTVNADVLVDSLAGFKPMNFVEFIRKSPWLT
ncbi:hypothetical protein PS880_02626 [Pseudomonas fluorescens]|uniref:Uncharacterized protein n=1 Tax=Pseudomonas fluorescens TaxID=294 RepID=A0A5E7K5X6_PSEFL|nr:hypothetical protein PS880_02626 [Pseudomonas fluorescens]